MATHKQPIRALWVGLAVLLMAVPAQAAQLCDCDGTLGACGCDWEAIQLQDLHGDACCADCRTPVAEAACDCGGCESDCTCRGLDPKQEAWSPGEVPTSLIELVPPATAHTLTFLRVNPAVTLDLYPAIGSHNRRQALLAVWLK
ncbi:MAG: hypothetical protein AAGF97_09775 [Planctomycetota bacterium]